MVSTDIVYIKTDCAQQLTLGVFDFTNGFVNIYVSQHVNDTFFCELINILEKLKGLK